MLSPPQFMNSLLFRWQISPDYQLQNRGSLLNKLLFQSSLFWVIFKLFKKHLQREPPFSDKRSSQPGPKEHITLLSGSTPGKAKQKIDSMQRKGSALRSPAPWPLRHKGEGVKEGTIIRVGLPTLLYSQARLCYLI